MPIEASLKFDAERQHQLPITKFDDLSSANSQSVSLDNHVWSTIQHAGMLVGSATINRFLVSGFLAPYLSERGVCLSNLVPVSFLESYQASVGPFLFNYSPLRKLCGWMGIQQSFFKSVAVAPVIEEVEHRYFLQNVILKKIPEAILQRVAPDYVDLINKWPVAVLRAFTVAVLFTALHTQALSCEDWGGIPQFLGGMLFGLLSEFKEGGFVASINLHMLNNYFSVLFPSDN